MTPPITFYPGPAKVYPQVRDWLLEAYESGVLSLNHRSRAFMDMCRQTIAGLRLAWNLPDDYEVMFAGSATEVWEILHQSFDHLPKYHLYNGAFGQKWAEYATRLAQWRGITPLPHTHGFGLQDTPPIAPFAHLDTQKPSLLCLTHNETSNGTLLPAEYLAALRHQYPHAVIALDATSSLGGLVMDWAKGDIWFGSVQKCLGLPAGLSILICSPRALSEMQQSPSHYNCLCFITENIRKYQTPYTPNVLNIYLLSRLVEILPKLATTQATLQQRAARLYDYLQQYPIAGQLLVQHSALRSPTVIVWQSSNRIIDRIKIEAEYQNIILGNGYGELKNETIRIANFPQHTEIEFALLLDFLDKVITDV